MRADGTVLTPAACAAAYRDACELDLQAFKPGNVSIYAAGHDMTVADFRRSAEASAPPLADPALSLGERIFYAIEATRAAVGCNTNLGIVLLAAPLMLAAQTVRPRETLRAAVIRILAGTTRNDADWAFRAIALAQPGGLGQAEIQDVREPPTVTLRAAMELAAGRDLIARQYANGYAEVFDFAIPSYHTWLSRWGDEAWAAAAVFLRLLQRLPDSHIERKFGTRHTRMVAARMAELENALSAAASPAEAVASFQAVDSEFKANGINPGTTADLTVACVLAVKLGCAQAFANGTDDSVHPQCEGTKKP
ncbi:triphosphoribosyl-dephospho-CoA synthase [Methylolobus aquaticus]